MVAKIFYIPAVISVGTIMGCTKPFMPTVTTTNANVLVVEGMINVADSTIIKLSRTVLISNKTTANPETKATISIENSQGTVYTLAETIKGTYVSPALTLDNTRQYRLHIKTSNGKVYSSTLVDVKVAPPIDSIGYTIKSNGMQVYVNTHDPANNTHYYKYDYRETWQFQSKYVSYIGSNGTALVDRTKFVQFCWGSDTSSNVIVNSTASLSQDVAYQFPISLVDSSSEKIETKYSILVSQQALTQETYTFWENLKKDTEELGSIFDAQPSQLIGNIHNVNDALEPVIGYISAGTFQKKRIFISRTALPQSWNVVYPYTCDVYMAAGLTYEESYPLFIKLPPPYTMIIDGLYTETPCADCSVRGTVQQPNFWK